MLEDHFQINDLVPDPYECILKRLSGQVKSARAWMHNPQKTSKMSTVKTEIEFETKKLFKFNFVKGSKAWIRGTQIER